MDALVLCLCWISLALPLVWADGTTTTPFTTTQICTGCECGTDGWQGFHSLESCAAACEMKSSLFNFDTNAGSGPNCACCNSLTITDFDENSGKHIYKRTDVAMNYYLECPLCWCDQDNWLGSRSFSECQTSCQGYERFQHANGQKPDGTTGDYNCACCTAGPSQANAWHELSPGGTLPSSRGMLAAVWSPTADGMYIFGGKDESAAILNDLHLYSRQANQWQQLSPSGDVPAAREVHAAAWSDAADGFYIHGGFSSENALDDLHFYSRQANAWQQVFPGGTAPSARWYHSAVWCPAVDGMYVYGGQGPGGGTGTGGTFSDLYFFDRQANTWQQLSPGGSLPLARDAHSAVWSPTADGMYIYGGWNPDLYSTSLGAEVYLGDFHFYDRQANTWQELSPGGTSPPALDIHEAVWSLAADGMYIFGGRETNSKGALSNLLYFYERKANTWHQLSPGGSLPAARWTFAALWSPEANGMYICAGTILSGSSHTRTNDLHFYSEDVGLMVYSTEHRAPLSINFATGEASRSRRLEGRILITLSLVFAGHFLM